MTQYNCSDYKSHHLIRLTKPISYELDHKPYSLRGRGAVGGFLLSSTVEIRGLRLFLLPLKPC